MPAGAFAKQKPEAREQRLGLCASLRPITRSITSDRHPLINGSALPFSEPWSRQPKQVTSSMRAPGRAAPPDLGSNRPRLATVSLREQSGADSDNARAAKVIDSRR